MATIKKTIENLKPGKQYLLTVKPKNLDINSVEDPVSVVRFAIPQDLSEPAELGNLEIVGNYKSIMISFNPSNEADLDGYNYEVYLPEDIGESGGVYQIIEGSTPYLSGFSSSNVIAIDVPENSTSTINNITLETTTTEKLYFARVQSIDTTGNVSPWTPIKASTATTLIDSAHIVNLTASKITAGTIGAHAITLAGATSIIKSSTFDGVDVGGGSYANATTGWLINGSGRAYFYDATIAGSIDIGGFDSGSFHVDSEGNLWLGSGTLVNAPFKVLKEGDVTANTITTKNLTLTGNTVISDNTKIYLGTGVYANTNTPFYVDDTDKFSLGNKLTWDGSTLTITGNVNITGGNTLTLINNAESNASTAYNTAISAQGIAISAQNDADDAYNLASTKITAGEVVTTINNGTTTISGDKITTGTLNADRISGGTITASIAMNSAAFNGGSINIAGNFRVDSAGTVECRNITVDSGLAYRGINFASSGSGTTARIEQLIGVQRITQPTSTIKVKKNIQDITNALETINLLKPRQFNFNEQYYGDIDPSTEEPWTEEAKQIHELYTSYGFVVEEVQEVNPQLVAYGPGEDRSFDILTWEPKMWRDLEIIAILTKAVQELSTKVEELESRLNS
jgi:hypothetical protein